MEKKEEKEEHPPSSIEVNKHLGPVVQSIVSLTSSLTGQLVSVFQLYNLIH